MSLLNQKAIVNLGFTQHDSFIYNATPCDIIITNKAKQKKDTCTTQHYLTTVC